MRIHELAKEIGVDNKTLVDFLKKEGANVKSHMSNCPPELVEAIISEQRRRDPTDVLGSWTGVPWDEHDEPVQDADDL